MWIGDAVGHHVHPRVLGLGEVMDYVNVLGASQEIFKKLELFHGKVIDGHSPSLTGQQLQAYALASITTDHESTTYEQAIERARAGMSVLIREGSASKNLDAIVEGIVCNQVSTDNFAFCTDDMHIEDIQRKGTIHYNVRRSVALGIPPVTAIKMATINATKIYGLEHIGNIAPGFMADIVVLDNLDDFKINRVFKSGIDVTNWRAPKYDKTARRYKNSIQIAKLKPDLFVLPEYEGESYPVIKIIDGQIITEKSEVAAERIQNELQSGNLCKIAVLERHHATGHFAVALLENYGLQRGAIATSFAHDSHNVIAVGLNDMNMCFIL